MDLLRSYVHDCLFSTAIFIFEYEIIEIVENFTPGQFDQFLTEPTNQLRSNELNDVNGNFPQKSVLTFNF